MSEKSELEIAKQKLRNSKDPAEREQAEKDIARLTELDISRDGAVHAACGNGAAGSAACAASRVEAYQFKAEYENTGNYNSRASQQYADAYGKIVNLLNITSVDAQNQQQVKDAMVSYTMHQLGVDKATAEQYVTTYDGMKIVAASMTPVIGSAAASKLRALVNEANSSNAAFSVSERVKENNAVSEKARESSNFGQYSKAEGGVQETLGIWPPNRGAYGPVEKVTLPTGGTVDRYGYPGGSFVSPVGVPFTERALPSSYEATKPYFKYEIIKPIPDVPKSKILPWFGQKGTGTQYELPKPVQWYLDNGYMKKVDK
ncbi:TNT domain-containing protein [Lonsdalea quercina]|uniref:TNT domain-containing protein n=1 Tax=Lonsdalea quercina TaxID=71657 RepID=UPI003976174D